MNPEIIPWPVNDAFVVTVLSVVPKATVARWMGSFARTRLPEALRRALLRWYVQKYQVDLDECEGTLDDFSTLVDLFTRPLRHGVRPVDPAPEAVVSPVDGRVYTVGTVRGGAFEQAPGMASSVAELCGGDHGFEGGAYAVLYLSPRDYHRVHVPREGVAQRYAYLPGRLWPVFPAATRRIHDLFARNERLVTWLATDLGDMALVMIGAFGVGRIRAVYTELVSNEGAPGRAGHLTPPLPLGRGAELGRFELGSTVILLFPAGAVSWTVQAGEPVRLGQRIGVASSPHTDQSAGSVG